MVSFLEHLSNPRSQVWLWTSKDLISHTLWGPVSTPCVNSRNLDKYSMTTVPSIALFLCLQVMAALCPQREVQTSYTNLPRPYAIRSVFLFDLVSSRSPLWSSSLATLFSLVCLRLIRDHSHFRVFVLLLVRLPSTLCSPKLFMFTSRHWDLCLSVTSYRLNSSASCSMALPLSYLHIISLIVLRLLQALIVLDAMYELTCILCLSLQH